VSKAIAAGGDRALVSTSQPDDDAAVGGAVRVFSANLLSELTARAEQSGHGRSHLNIHSSYAEQCQRLFNAIGLQSYIRPHRHLADPKPESLVAVRGRFVAVLFDDRGWVTEAISFGTEAYGGDESLPVGVELAPGVWHTVLADVPGSVLFEVKAGPFDPTLAKELANWSPPERSPEAPSYLADLRRSAAALTAGRGR